MHPRAVTIIASLGEEWHQSPRVHNDASEYLIFSHFEQMKRHRFNSWRREWGKSRADVKREEEELRERERTKNKVERTGREKESLATEVCRSWIKSTDCFSALHVHQLWVGYSDRKRKWNLTWVSLTLNGTCIKVCYFAKWNARNNEQGERKKERLGIRLYATQVLRLKEKKANGLTDSLIFRMNVEK